MNRFEEHPIPDDGLGQMIRWSLRSDASRLVRPQTSWPRIQERVQAWEHARSALNPRRALAREIVAVFRALWTACLGAWQFVDERTLSSESVWVQETYSGPRTLMMLRHLQAVQLITSWPLLGQKLPII
jgi:hypothetical protein